MLLEAAELAHGASGRNLGLVDPPKDPVLDPLARRSVERYLELTADPASAVFFDREPIGTISVAIDEDDVGKIREEEVAAIASGIAVERLDATALRELEPGLTHATLEGVLLHEGRRVDPGALTVRLAHAARELGATIRHHTPARRLVTNGDSVTGVVTDDETLSADVVLLAAGPWSPALLRPLGIRLPVAGARGWLVQLAPAAPPIRRWIEGAARSLWRRRVEPVPASAFAEGDVPIDVGAILQPSPDGSIVVGTSREPALTAEPFGSEVARAVTAEAIRLVPSLADAPVVATWSGVRPMTLDEKPLIGWLTEGLFVASGHGSEGVILGGGTADLVGATIAAEPPPFDLAPFDPHRFD